jgi:hypothetical protein
MIKKFFKMLDAKASQEDAIMERLEKEPKVMLQLTYLGLSIIMILLMIIIMIFSIYKAEYPPPPPSFALTINDKGFVEKSEQIVTLPFPHQSIKNVSAWLLDALNASYAFDFSHIDEQIDAAEYYFTPEGYKMYLTALETSKYKADIFNKKLQVTILPIKNPVIINDGSAGDTEFWRLRTPILITYYGGKEPVVIEKTFEALIVRVPAYKNKKGLAITEFIMSN